MKLLQVTDTHVGRPGLVAHGVDPRARLEACVADINAHHADAALCLLTGDLVNEGGAEEYANLAAVLRDLQVPLRVMTGNHDQRRNLLQAFPHTPVDANGFCQSTFDVPGGRLLVLDTLREGHASGELCELRLRWLRDALQEASGTAGDAVYIAMHHPPVALGMELLDRIGLSNAEDFWHVLMPHRARIGMLLFGHAHRPVSGLANGIAFAGCPSTVHQVALELGAARGPRLSYNLEPPCYAIIDLQPGRCVVHQQRYSENWNTVP